MIETVDDIIESLADELGIYGAHIDLHPDGQCECRFGSCTTCTV